MLAMKRGLLAVFCLGVATCKGACLDETESWTGQVTLEADESLILQYKVVDADLRIALSAPTMKGYVGFGIGEDTSGSMVGADIVTISFDEKGEAIVEDRYVPFVSFPFAPFGEDFVYGNVQVETSPSLFPFKDVGNSGRDDWKLVRVRKETSCHSVVLQRKLVTGDNNDRDVKPGKKQVAMWALGDSMSITYHSDKRGTVGIDFGKSMAQEEEYTCPDCETFMVGIGNYDVLPQVTTYTCNAVELPYKGQDQHIVAIYPVIDQTKYVHHILVHSCDSSSEFWQKHTGVGEPVPCNQLENRGVGISPLGTLCDTLVTGWAPGQDAFILPEKAGIRVTSARRFYMIEVHYNNPGLDQGVKDNTGMKLVLSNKLREFDSGTLVVGDPGTRMDALPPGQVTHRLGVCAPECTEPSLANGPIRIMGSFLHMHSFGKRMWTNVYSKNMTYKGTLNKVDFWNFETQRNVDVSEFLLEPGDTLFTHCEYDTTKWPRQVTFGQDSLEEMCMDFVYWYGPTPTYNGHPLTLCGGASGFIAGISNSKHADIVEAIGYDWIFSMRPSWKDRMFMNLCNRGVVESSYTENLSGFDVPLQRNDPREWMETEGLWRNEVQFGTPNDQGDVGPAQPTEKGEFELGSIPDGMMSWQVASDGSGTSCALSVSITFRGENWFAIGLGANMKDSHVLVVENGLASEHTISGYFLEDIKRFSAGLSSGVSNFESSVADGKTTFKMELTSIAGKDLQLPCSSGSGAARDALIFAYGDSKLMESEHQTTFQTTVDWRGGSTSDKTSVTLQLHAFLMTIGFALLTPAAVAFPVMKRPSEGTWFTLHQSFASLAVLLVIGGLVTGILYTAVHFDEAHHWIGIAAVFFLLLNPVLGMLRPDKDAARRPAWLIAHRICGSLGLLLGWVNIFLGAKLVVDRALPGFFQSSALIVASVAVGIGALTLIVSFFLRDSTYKTVVALEVKSTQSGEP